jgi:arginyl-tRNA synthetase
MASTSTNTELKQGDAYYLPPVPSVKGADTETAIIEAYRIAAAKIVSEAVDIPLETAYPGIDVGNKKADLYVAMPRFRLGGKPDQWAEKVVAHVSSTFPPIE